MGGHTVPTVLDGLPVDLVPMYFELDGTFPNHEANPLDPTNLRRPAGAGARGGRRHRAGLRRRRRPLLRHRRARRAGLAVRRHGAGRRARAGPAPGRDGDPQPDHLARGARDRPRARRHAGAHPGRALVHQGRDGAHRRGLRRRALGALLLPRLLARRHRHARRAARARRARRAGASRCPSWPPTYERYVASGEINSVVADQAARHGRTCARAYAGRPGRRRSTSWTG